MEEIEMETKELLKLLTFLSPEEREEIEEKVKEKAAKASQSFSLRGSWSGHCDLQEPHPPHYTDEGYDTVRHGYVQRFCSGVEGKGLTIAFIVKQHGDAYSLSHIQGFWIRS